MNRVAVNDTLDWIIALHTPCVVDIYGPLLPVLRCWNCAEPIEYCFAHGLACFEDEGPVSFMCTEYEQLPWCPYLECIRRPGEPEDYCYCHSVDKYWLFPPQPGYNPLKGPQLELALGL